MTLTVKIEGMMCEHCVRAVKSALEALDGVRADVSLEEGVAVLTGESMIDAAAVRAAVEDEGYTVVSIR